VIQRTESVERIGRFVADVRVGIAKGDIQGTYCARIFDFAQDHRSTLPDIRAWILKGGNEGQDCRCTDLGN
jgi:hypothetical protein